MMVWTSVNIIKDSEVGSGTREERIKSWIENVQRMDVQERGKVAVLPSVEFRGQCV